MLLVTWQQEDIVTWYYPVVSSQFKTLSLCRGIDKLRVYGFGCPPCMDKDLAEQCADYVLMVALRDDVVTRFSPQALERLQKELRDLDLEAAKQVRHSCILMNMSCQDASGQQACVEDAALLGRWRGLLSCEASCRLQYFFGMAFICPRRLHDTQQACRVIPVFSGLMLFWRWLC